MTTPRDDIGLSERLRAWAPMIASGYECPAASMAMHEAATQLDALSARVNEADEACQRLCGAHGFATGHGDSVADMIDEISTQIGTLEERATRAEQERDEALKRLKPFADAAESLYESHLDLIDLWESPSGLEITAGHLRAARDLVRRLAAGTEKEGK